MACGFDSPKVHLTIGDGFEFMKNHREKFDVIITDSSDPIGKIFINCWGLYVSDNTFEIFLNFQKKIECKKLKKN